MNYYDSYLEEFEVPVMSTSVSVTSPRTVSIGEPSAASTTSMEATPVSLTFPVIVSVGTTPEVTTSLAIGSVEVAGTSSWVGSSTDSLSPGVSRISTSSFSSP